MSDPMELAAIGSSTDKIAPPDLICSIFFSFYTVVFF